MCVTPPVSVIPRAAVCRLSTQCEVQCHTRVCVCVCHIETSSRGPMRQKRLGTTAMTVTGEIGLIHETT